MLSKKVLTVSLMMLLTVTTVACKARRDQTSQTKDVSLVNSDPTDVQTQILYEQGDEVFLRSCTPPVAPPLSRTCPSTQRPEDVPHMPVSTYRDMLPFDTGTYERTANGLALAQAALTAAQNAAENGNRQAGAAVPKLQTVVANLTKIKTLMDFLVAGSDATYFEFNSEFDSYLVPFGVRAPGSSSGTGTPTAVVTESNFETFTKSADFVVVISKQRYQKDEIAVLPKYAHFISIGLIDCQTDKQSCEHLGFRILTMQLYYRGSLLISTNDFGDERVKFYTSLDQHLIITKRWSTRGVHCLMQLVCQPDDLLGSLENISAFGRDEAQAKARLDQAAQSVKEKFQREGRTIGGIHRPCDQISEGVTPLCTDTVVSP